MSSALACIGLAVIHALAAEAGLTLTSDVTWKAAVVLAEAERGHATGNARLAVQLLTQATTSQAYRVTTSAQPCDPAALAAICAADIPDCMPSPAPTTRSVPRPVPLTGQSRRRLRHLEEAPAASHYV